MPNIMKRAQTSGRLDTAQGVPAGWAESLERSEAQIAAGQTVPLEPILDELRASIARMEAKRAAASNK